MTTYRNGNDTVSDLTMHVVFTTKYRYHVLRDEVQVRCRDLICGVCDVLDVQIIKGVLRKDHVHLHLSYPPQISVSEIMGRIKKVTSKKLMEEFAHLHKRYYGKHFWSEGYGACSSGDVTQEMIDSYLDHHGSAPNGSDVFILE